MQNIKLEAAKSISDARAAENLQIALCTRLESQHEIDLLL